MKRSILLYSKGQWNEHRPFAVYTDSHIPRVENVTNGIITDVYVTPGNVHDAVPHTGRLEYQIDKFDFQTKAICADASYDSSEV